MVFLMCEDPFIYQFIVIMMLKLETVQTVTFTIIQNFEFSLKPDVMVAQFFSAMGPISFPQLLGTEIQCLGLL